MHHIQLGPTDRESPLSRRLENRSEAHYPNRTAPHRATRREGDPTDPGTPDDAPEPSSPRTPTLDVNDDDEPKTTGLFSEIKGVPPTGTGVDVLDSRLVEIDFAQLADAIESRRTPPPASQRLC